MTDFIKVPQEKIAELLARVIYRVEHPEGTTSTLVHAFLDDRYYLASGHSGCIDTRMYSAETGERLARSSAEANAIKALWQMEGYMLYSLTVATEIVTKHFEKQE